MILTSRLLVGPPNRGIRSTPIMEAIGATSVSSPKTASRYIISAMRRRPISTPKKMARKVNSFSVDGTDSGLFISLFIISSRILPNRKVPVEDAV